MMLFLWAQTGFAVGEGGSPFSAGSSFGSVTFGRSHDPYFGSIYLAQIHRSDYIDDGLAFYYGANIGYGESKKTTDGFQGGPEVGLRWHFWEKGRWTTYLNGSVGALFHQHALTEDSLRFNFDLQGGLGTTCRISEKLLLQSGIGWHHLSNARIRGKEHNLGYDGPLIYLGVMRPLFR